MNRSRVSSFAALLAIMLLAGLISLLARVRAEDCSNFNQYNACKSGSQTENPSDWAARNFYTPLPGSQSYKTTAWQYYGLLQGYSRLYYSSDRQKARVSIILRIRPDLYKKIDTGAAYLVYKYDGKQTTSSVIDVDTRSHSSKVLQVEVNIIDFTSKYVTAKLMLDYIDFVWNAPTVPAPTQPDVFEGGQKGAIVELFGWPYADIKNECAMLAKAGYMGVKVFPPQESVLTFEWLQSGELNPWWFIYQPVSYKLDSRWGSRAYLRDMIYTCRKLGVRVYADAVVNHMAGSGNDVFPDHRAGGGGGSCAHWGAKNSTALSPYYTQGFAFSNWTQTGYPAGNEFPAVPYGPLDFHCERSLSSWSDPFALNYAWLVGLVDLNTESTYVRQRIADYLTDLLSLGFSGIRVDAAKHISPDNLAAIFSLLRTNMGGVDLPGDFMAYLEVIIGGEKDLLMCQYSSYNYAQYFVDAMTKAGLSTNDINKIKIWDSTYPKEFPICGSWAIPAERLVVENDCHDDQVPGSSSRDMGDRGSVLVKEKNVDKHRDFEKYLFERTDGNWKHRLVLSSYTFMNDAYGPPDGLSDCRLCVGQYCSQCKSVPYSKAYDPNACGYTVYDQSGNWAQGRYTRVHRDFAIIKSMRQWLGLPMPSSPEDVGLPSLCN